MALPGVHQVKFAVITTASSGDTTVIAGVTGKRLTVINYVIVSTSALSVKFRTGTTDITGAMAVPATGILGAIGTPASPLFQTAVGDLFAINLSGTTQVSGHVAYIEEG